MKEVIIQSVYIEYESSAEMSEADNRLVECARRAADRAYAPYSGFHVGAAVRLANGVIVEGNNQENAAYPSGLCAERVALFAASANYNGIPIESIAVTAKSIHKKLETPVSPCGACRQVMTEYENIHNQKIKILLTGETGKVYQLHSVSDLLPLLFSDKDLK